MVDIDWNHPKMGALPESRLYSLFTIIEVLNSKWSRKRRPCLLDDYDFDPK